MFTTSLAPSWAPACAVFDCDGVLLDSETAWNKVQAQLFAHHGLNLTPDIEESLVGSAAEDLARVLTELRLPNASRTEREHFLSRTLATVKQTERHILESGIEPIKGALETVAKLASTIPVAVASNSSKELLNQKLTTFGYAKHLSAWVSADDVATPKPAPDMYLEAIRRIGGTPETTLTVEDSPAGATAALTAGTRLFFFGNSSDDAPGAAGYFSSFCDPDFVKQINNWAQ